MAHDLAYLCRIRQAHLRNYQYRSSEEPNMMDVIPLADELKHLSTIELLLRNRHDCTIAGELLQRTRRLQHLSIGFSAFKLDGSLGTESETTLAAINDLFGSSRKGRSNSQLTTLHLERMDFAGAGVIIPTLTDLRELKHLRLYKCRGARYLMEALTQMRMPLTSLSLDSINVSEVNVLKAFLQSVTLPGNLSRLRLAGNMYLSKDQHGILDALIDLAPKLKSLALEDGVDVYSLVPGGRPGDVKMLSLCKSLKVLEQLSLHVPDIETPFDEEFGLDRVLVSTCVKLKHCAVRLTPGRHASNTCKISALFSCTARQISTLVKLAKPVGPTMWKPARASSSPK